MQNTKHMATFAVDGYEVSATFAPHQNTAAIGQVKQILLSAFAANTHNPRPGGILAIPPEQRDNNSRGNPNVP